MRVFASAAGLAACSVPYGSVGAVFVQRDGQVVVRSAPKTLGAGKAGVEEGDVLLFIDDEDVRELRADEIALRLRGPVGSPVVLTLLRRHADGTESVARIVVRRTPYQR